MGAQAHHINGISHSHIDTDTRRSYNGTHIRTGPHACWSTGSSVRTLFERMGEQTRRTRCHPSQFAIRHFPEFARASWSRPRPHA